MRCYGVIPKWYGLSYALTGYDVYIVYPIPLNYLVRWIRQLYKAIKCGHPLSSFMAAESFKSGYELRKQEDEEKCNACYINAHIKTIKKVR